MVIGAILGGSSNFLLNAVLAAGRVRPPMSFDAFGAHFLATSLGAGPIALIIAAVGTVIALSVAAVQRLKEREIRSGRRRLKG